MRRFIEAGYASTTLKAIASEAGVAERTVYSSFGDKEAVARGLVERTAPQDANVQPLLSALSTEPTMEGRIRMVVHANREALESASFELRDAIIQGAASDPRLSALVDRFVQEGRQTVGVILDHVLGPDTDASVDRVRLRDAVWPLTSSGVYRRLTESCGWTADEYEDWLADLIGHLVGSATSS